VTILTVPSRQGAKLEPAATILLVEDDIEIGGQLRRTLEMNNYRVRWCVTAESALKAMSEQKPDLVLLDIGLPDMDGFALCRELQSLRQEMPIVMVTAADSDIDVVMGLDSGACDYVTKPFTSEVLLARIRAHLRQITGKPDCAPVVHRNIVVSPDSITVMCHGAPIDLRLREFELLLYLCRAEGRVVTRRELFAEIWEVRWVNHSKTLDMHIHALRQKLGDEIHISTVRGVGYRLELG
jgi:two-component system, OmpR family, response regulator RegX3